MNLNSIRPAGGTTAVFCVFLITALTNCKREAGEIPSSNPPPVKQPAKSDFEEQSAKPDSEEQPAKPASKEQSAKSDSNEEFTKPHSVLIYRYKIENKDSGIIRIYSWFRVRDGESLKFSTNEVGEGGSYRYENGTAITFKGGTVICGDERFENLSGNYVFSDKGISEGFIRTFD